MAEKRPLANYSGVIQELSVSDTLPAGSSIKKTITQASHGFAAGDAIRRDSGGSYVKAKADTAANAEGVGVVESVAGDDFVVVFGGWIAGLSGLTDASVYYLSAATAGLLTATEPDPETYISKPLLIATSTTTGVVVNMRGLSQTATEETDEDVMGSALVAASNTSLRYGFVTSNQSRLFDGTEWVIVRKSSEPTAANNADDVAGVDLAVDNIYDVFEYRDSDTGTSLHFRKWATTAARTAAWATSTNYKKGDARTDTNYYVAITDHLSSSSNRPNGGGDSADYWLDLGAAPTQGIVPSDFYGLNWLDGRLVLGPNSTGANSWDGRKYRWLGCIYTYSNGGTVNFKDEKQYNYISNFYNKRAKPIGKDCPYSSTTTRTVPAYWEPWNNSTTEWKIPFVLCESRTVDATCECEAYNTAGLAGAALGLTLDSTSATVAGSSVASTNVSNTSSICQIAKYNGVVTPGYHYLMPLEEADTANTVFRYYYAPANGRDTRAAVSGTIEG